jgi:hypothetical protein
MGGQQVRPVPKVEFKGYSFDLEEKIALAFDLKATKMRLTRRDVIAALIEKWVSDEIEL